MGLLYKKTLMVMLMISCLSFVEIFCADENISTLVSTLVDPKIIPEVHQATQEETDESDTPADEISAPLAVPESKKSMPEESMNDASAKEPDVKESTLPTAVAVAPKEVTPVTPVVPVAAVTPIAPVVAKVMPVAPVSPIQAKSQNDVATSTVASKIVKAPTPIFSKSVSTPIQIVDVPEDEIKGLDTLNVDSSGNWLEKRIWYQKGEQLFEVIRGNLQKAADLRMQFVHEVNQVGHKIDEFYENMSFQKGEIDEMLTAVLQDLSNQQEIRGGDLSSSERSVKSKVQTEQKHFEVLGKDLKLIEDLDDQIDKTMMKAFKEIDACRGLETRAWNNFKEIGLELDDKKARVLYYEMENFHKNIEQKMHYLQNNLLPYLQSQLVSKVDETMTQIKSAIQIFDSKGLNLTAILKKDEHGDFLILKQRDEMQLPQEAQAKQAAQAKKQAALSWYENIFCSIVSFVQPVLCKLQEWVCVAICFVQSVFCNILQWICRLFGY